MLDFENKIELYQKKIKKKKTSGTKFGEEIKNNIFPCFIIHKMWKIIF